MNLAERIANSELEVMNVLWDENAPLSFYDIRTRLQSLKSWDKSTINTLIRRLVQKDVISVNKEDVLYYSANISRDEYKDYYVKNLVERVFDGDIKNFVSALCNVGELSEDDIDELKEYFRNGDYDEKPI